MEKESHTCAKCGGPFPPVRLEQKAMPTWEAHLDEEAPDEGEENWYEVLLKRRLKQRQEQQPSDRATPLERHSHPASQVLPGFCPDVSPQTGSGRRTLYSTPKSVLGTSTAADSESASDVGLWQEESPSLLSPDIRDISFLSPCVTSVPETQAELCFQKDVTSTPRPSSWREGVLATQGSLVSTPVSWTAPPLGDSPGPLLLTVEKGRCGLAELGLDFSNISWTSSMATPCHLKGDTSLHSTTDLSFGDTVIDHSIQTSQRKAKIPRVLFSPDASGLSEMLGRTLDSSTQLDAPEENSLLVPDLRDGTPELQRSHRKRKCSFSQEPLKNRHLFPGPDADVTDEGGCPTGSKVSAAEEGMKSSGWSCEGDEKQSRTMEWFPFTLPSPQGQHSPPLLSSLPPNVSRSSRMNSPQHVSPTERAQSPCLFETLSSPSKNYSQKNDASESRALGWKTPVGSTPPLEDTVNLVEHVIETPVARRCKQQNRRRTGSSQLGRGACKLRNDVKTPGSLGSSRSVPDYKPRKITEMPSPIDQSEGAPRTVNDGQKLKLSCAEENDRLGSFPSMQGLNADTDIAVESFVPSPFSQKGMSAHNTSHPTDLHHTPDSVPGTILHVQVQMDESENIVSLRTLNQTRKRKARECSLKRSWGSTSEEGKPKRSRDQSREKPATASAPAVAAAFDENNSADVPGKAASHEEVLGLLSDAEVATNSSGSFRTTRSRNSPEEPPVEDVESLSAHEDTPAIVTHGSCSVTAHIGADVESMSAHEDTPAAVTHDSCSVAAHTGADSDVLQDEEEGEVTLSTTLVLPSDSVPAYGDPVSRRTEGRFVSSASETAWEVAVATSRESDGTDSTADSPAERGKVALVSSVEKTLTSSESGVPATEGDATITYPTGSSQISFQGAPILELSSRETVCPRNAAATDTSSDHAPQTCSSSAVSSGDVSTTSSANRGMVDNNANIPNISLVDAGSTPAVDTSVPEAESVVPSSSKNAPTETGSGRRRHARKSATFVYPSSSQVVRSLPEKRLHFGFAPQDLSVSHPKPGSKSGSLVVEGLEPDVALHDTQKTASTPSGEVSKPAQKPDHATSAEVKENASEMPECRSLISVSAETTDSQDDAAVTSAEDPSLDFMWDEEDPSWVSMQEPWALSSVFSKSKDAKPGTFHEDVPVEEKGEQLPVNDEEKRLEGGVFAEILDLGESSKKKLDQPEGGEDEERGEGVEGGQNENDETLPTQIQHMLLENFFTESEEQGVHSVSRRSSATRVPLELSEKQTSLDSSVRKPESLKNSDLHTEAAETAKILLADISEEEALRECREEPRNSIGLGNLDLGILKNGKGLDFASKAALSSVRGVSEANGSKDAEIVAISEAARDVKMKSAEVEEKSESSNSPVVERVPVKNDEPISERSQNPSLSLGRLNSISKKKVQSVSLLSESVDSFSDSPSIHHVKTTPEKMDIELEKLSLTDYSHQKSLSLTRETPEASMKISDAKMDSKENTSSADLVRIDEDKEMVQKAVVDLVMPSKQEERTLEKDDHDRECSEIPQAFVGVRTAAGTSISFSEKALGKAQQLVEGSSEEKSDERDRSFKAVQGFSISPGESALEKSSESIEFSLELNHDEKNKTVKASFEGFRTASEGSIPLSKNALEKAKKLCESSLEQSSDEGKGKLRAPQGFGGFTTASGNSIPLSENALEKAKKLCESSLEQSTDEGKRNLRAPQDFEGVETVGTRMQLDEGTMTTAEIKPAGFFSEEEWEQDTEEPEVLTQSKTSSGTDIQLTESEILKDQNQTSDETDSSTLEKSVQFVSGVFPRNVASPKPIADEPSHWERDGTSKGRAAVSLPLQQPQGLQPFKAPRSTDKTAPGVDSSATSSHHRETQETGLLQAEEQGADMLEAEDISAGGSSKDPRSPPVLNSASQNKGKTSDQQLPEKNADDGEKRFPAGDKETQRRPNEPADAQVESNDLLLTQKQLMLLQDNVFNEVEENGTGASSHRLPFTVSAPLEPAEAAEDFEAREEERHTMNQITDSEAAERKLPCENLGTDGVLKEEQEAMARQLRKKTKLSEPPGVEEIFHVRSSEILKAFDDIVMTTESPTPLSKSSVEKTKELCEVSVEQHTDGGGETIGVPQGFEGFRTASGTSILLSKNALEKAKKLCDLSLEQTCGEESRIVKAPQSFEGFKTALGTSIPLSKSAVEKAKKLCDLSLEQTCGEESGTVKVPQPFEGFKTALGTSIPLSKSAVEKAKKLCDLSLEQTCGEESGTVKVPQPFEGFKTALGTSIPLSKSAVEKAKKLCDLSLEQTCGEESGTVKVPQPFEGFKTALGTSIPLSKSAVEKAKKLCEYSLEQKSDEGSRTDIPHPFEGFKTASGARMQVDQRALGNAKRKFADWFSEDGSGKISEMAESLTESTAVCDTNNILHQGGVTSEVPEPPAAEVVLQSGMSNVPVSQRPQGFRPFRAPRPQRRVAVAGSTASSVQSAKPLPSCRQENVKQERSASRGPEDKIPKSSESDSTTVSDGRLRSKCRQAVFEKKEADVTRGENDDVEIVHSVHKVQKKVSVAEVHDTDVTGSTHEEIMSYKCQIHQLATLPEIEGTEPLAGEQRKGSDEESGRKSERVTLSHVDNDDLLSTQLQHLLFQDDVFSEPEEQVTDIPQDRSLTSWTSGKNLKGMETKTGTPETLAKTDVDAEVTLARDTQIHTAKSSRELNSGEPTAEEPREMRNEMTTPVLVNASALEVEKEALADFFPSSQCSSQVSEPRALERSKSEDTAADFKSALGEVRQLPVENSDLVKPTPEESSKACTDSPVVDAEKSTQLARVAVESEWSPKENSPDTSDVHDETKSSAIVRPERKDATENESEPGSFPWEGAEGGTSNARRMLPRQNCVRDTDVDAEVECSPNAESEDLQAFVGFRTARGTSIPLSRQSLEKARLVCELPHEQNTDKDGKSFKPHQDFVGFKTASGVSIPLSVQALEKAKHLCEYSCEQNSDKENGSDKVCRSSIGFKTAAGTSIPLSKQALEKSKQLCESSHGQNSDDEGGSLRACPSFMGFKAATEGSEPRIWRTVGTTEQQFRLSLEHSLDDDDHSCTSHKTFQGFKMASGAQISLSEKALGTVKRQFGDWFGEEESPKLSSLNSDFLVPRESCQMSSDGKSKDLSAAEETICSTGPPESAMLSRQLQAKTSTTSSVQIPQGFRPFKVPRPVSKTSLLASSSAATWQTDKSPDSCQQSRTQPAEHQNQSEISCGGSSVCGQGAVVLEHTTHKDQMEECLGDGTSELFDGSSQKKAVSDAMAAFGCDDAVDSFCSTDVPKKAAGSCSSEVRDQIQDVDNPLPCQSEWENIPSFSDAAIAACEAAELNDEEERRHLCLVFPSQNSCQPPEDLEDLDDTEENACLCLAVSSQEDLRPQSVGADGETESWKNSTNVSQGFPTHWRPSDGDKKSLNWNVISSGDSDRDSSQRDCKGTEKQEPPVSACSTSLFPGDKKSLNWNVISSGDSDRDLTQRDFRGTEKQEPPVSACSTSLFPGDKKSLNWNVISSGDSDRDSSQRDFRGTEKQEPPVSACSTSLFSTASGSAVVVSSRALEAVTGKFPEEDTNQRDGRFSLGSSASSSHNRPSFFSTAAGTKISISAEALTAVRAKVLDDFEQGGDHHSCDSATDGADFAERLNEMEEPLEVGTYHKGNGVGGHDKPVSNVACTASGQFASVSGRALEAMQGSGTAPQRGDILQTVPPRQSQSGGRVSGPQRALEAVQAHRRVHQKPVLPKTAMSRQGYSPNPFCTASGTEVSVSEKALRAVQGKTLTESVVRSATASSVSEYVSACPFSTASGSAVAVSEKALQAIQGRGASTKSDPVPPVSSSSDRHTLANSFSTASGNVITVSGKALRAVQGKTGFTESFGESPGPSASKKEVLANAFSTASGNVITVSEKALRAVQGKTGFTESFGESPGPSASKKEVLANAFSTASGSMITVSEKALRAVQGKAGLMESTSEPPVSSTCTSQKRILANPFSTASGTAISVSEKALRAVQGTSCASDYSVCSEKRLPLSSAPRPQSHGPCGNGSPASASRHKVGVTSRPNAVEMPGGGLELPDRVESSKEAHSHLSGREDHEVAERCKTTVVTNKILQDPSSQQSGPEACEKTTTGTLVIADSSAPVEEISREVHRLWHGALSNRGTAFLDVQAGAVLQEKILKARKAQPVRPAPGRYFQQKSETSQPVYAAWGQELRLHPLGRQHHPKPVSPAVRRMTSEDAKHHRLSVRGWTPRGQVGCLWVGDGALLVPDNKGFAGASEFYRAMLTLEGVDAALLSEEWVENHFRWVAWKLARYERSFPQAFAGRALTPDEVMLQLKLRYDREIDNCQRSALRKILEQDDVPGKRMVLLVASIRRPKMDGAGKNKAQEVTQVQLELTDGWYAVPACLDGQLQELVLAGRIAVGDKLCIAGAHLAGATEACCPLSVPEGLCLALSGNSVRPAHWSAKLGFQRNPQPLRLPLSSLSPRGSLVGCVDVLIARVLPIAYMEKLPGERTVFRSAESEERACQEYEDQRAAKVEELQVQIQRESEKDRQKGRSAGQIRSRQMTRRSRAKLASLQTGAELYELLGESDLFEDLQGLLTEQQMQLLMQERMKRCEEEQSLLKDEVLAALEKTKFATPRSVIPLIRFLILGCAKQDVDSRTSALLSVWRPGEEWQQVEEGRSYRIFNLNVTQSRSRLVKGLTLTATRQSGLKPLSLSENIQGLLFHPREVWTVGDLLNERPPYGLFDFVGLIMRVNRECSPELVYLCDAASNILEVSISGGLKNIGPERSLMRASLATVTGLLLRSRPRSLGDCCWAEAEANLDAARFSTAITRPFCRQQARRFKAMSQEVKEQLLKKGEDQLEMILSERRQRLPSSVTLSKPGPARMSRLPPAGWTSTGLSPTLRPSTSRQLGSFPENYDEESCHSAFVPEVLGGVADERSRELTSAAANPDRSSSVSHGVSAGNSSRQFSLPAEGPRESARRDSATVDASAVEGIRQEQGEGSTPLTPGATPPQPSPLQLQHSRNRQKASRLSQYRPAVPLTPLPVARSAAVVREFKPPSRSSKS